MTDIKEWRKSVREAAMEAIPPALIAGGPMKVSTIYEMMLDVAPEVCDSGISCEHNGVRYGLLEWQHQVRWALEYLKAKEKVRRVPNVG